MPLQGQIIGGVIGSDVVRYDIYGQTVVIANSMESNGERGRVLVSSVTKTLIEAATDELFIFTRRAEIVKCPSIGAALEAFFVEEKHCTPSWTSRPPA